LSDHSRVGRDGESLVAAKLAAEGWLVIARNWRTRSGEIDIIAIETDTLVFIEVKTWPNGDALDLERAIGRTKRKRIVETAKCFLDTHRQYNGMYVRFDVVLVNSVVRHLKDAFSERV